MFLDYLRSLNDLHQNPQFYNALTSNCTTNVRVHTVATAPDKPPPWDRRILLNGFADQMLYERAISSGSSRFLISKNRRSSTRRRTLRIRIRSSRRELVSRSQGFKNKISPTAELRPVGRSRTIGQSHKSC